MCVACRAVELQRCKKQSLVFGSGRSASSPSTAVVAAVAAVAKVKAVQLLGLELHTESYLCLHA